MAKVVYTVGIRRKFLPIYKKYKVVDHVQNTFIVRNEFKDALNVIPRLFLDLVDGSQVCVSRIDQRDWKVYPDYREKVELETKERLKQAAKVAKQRRVETPAVEAVVEEAIQQGS